jgi:imidazolonepropionase-like amidohydrolase
MSPADTRVVRAGRLVDVVSGEVHADRALVLEGDRIADVVPASDAPSAETIDLSDRTVLPGLIDCHAHLIGELEAGNGYGFLVGRSAAQEALTGVPNARATLRGGVTTVRDVGTFYAFVDIALRDAIDAGAIEGPRMRCAGAYVTCPGGGGDITGLPPGTSVPRSSGWGSRAVPTRSARTCGGSSRRARTSSRCSRRVRS